MATTWGGCLPLYTAPFPGLGRWSGCGVGSAWWRSRSRSQLAVLNCPILHPGYAPVSRRAAATSAATATGRCGRRRWTMAISGARVRAAVLSGRSRGLRQPASVCCQLSARSSLGKLRGAGDVGRTRDPLLGKSVLARAGAAPERYPVSPRRVRRRPRATGRATEGGSSACDCGSDTLTITTGTVQLACQILDRPRR